MTLTRKDIVGELTAKHGIDSVLAAQILETTLTKISNTIEQGNRVELRSFGVFSVVTRKAKIGRNPNQPEKDIVIPARPVCKFAFSGEINS